MEAATVSEATAGGGTGSKTVADLLPLSAKVYGERAAVRWKNDSGRWVSHSFTEVGEIVEKLALGLIDLGIEKGDKVSILANTRPEWTYVDFAALSVGATVVPIYQTNSAEECQYVLENSDARLVIVEDEEQLAKIRAVRDRLPKLEQIVIMEGTAGDAIGLDELRRRGDGRDRSEWEARYSSVTPDDICTFIYTSGTTGPPKGCVISHGNYRAMLDMTMSVSVVEPGDIVYLFLPLAHSFALLLQLGSFDVGGSIAYWERDPLKIIPNLGEVRPHYFPSVPRIFEKIYTAATSAADKEGGIKKRIFWWAIGVGKKMRETERRGEKPGFLLARQYALADSQVLAEDPRPVRGSGPPVRQRRRPDQLRDPRVLRRRRRPRPRGLRDDRDLDGGDDLDAVRLQVRHRRPALPGLRGEDRRRRRGPDQGPEHLPGLLQERGGDVGDDRRRLAPHRRHRRDRQRRLPVDHRPQEGHHHHRRGQEHHPRQPRGRDQAAPARQPVRRRSATAGPTWSRSSPSTPRRPPPTPPRTACPTIPRRSPRTPTSTPRSWPTSSRSTPSSPASSRSRRSRSSPTTSPRRPAS